MESEAPSRENDRSAKEEPRHAHPRQETTEPKRIVLSSEHPDPTRINARMDTELAQWKKSKVVTALPRACM